MRVITGIAKGVPLKSLPGKDTRPTSDKAKEAMFSAVQFDIPNAVVLDLFAGSGQLGIEALSRGAKMAYFVDNNPRAAEVIKANLEKTGIPGQSFRVDRMPYNTFLRLVRDKFDIVFLDPPYGKGIIAKVIPVLAKLMNPGGIIVCEHEKELCLPESIGMFEVDRTYNYGSISLTIYRSVQ